MEPDIQYFTANRVLALLSVWTLIGYQTSVKQSNRDTFARSIHPLWDFNNPSTVLMSFWESKWLTSENQIHSNIYEGC